MAVHGNTLSERIEDEQIDSTALAADVRDGLTRFPKRLSSRFFYDAEGSRLFQEIMQLPEYYLTQSEYEILDSYKGDLLALAAAHDRAFDLIELGAGDGLKTKVLLGHFLEKQARFSYIPIDISETALDQLTDDLKQKWPSLSVQPQHDEYFHALSAFNQSADAPRRVILFLGSNIGNFTLAETKRFYRQLYQQLRPGDLVLTGFDLKKSPPIIQAAYNDKQGVTRAFNLNLLRRINRELDANFDLNAFDHVVGYNAASGEMCSYLSSLCNQEVYIRALDLTVSFFQGEAMRTEISRKFTRTQIEQLAKGAGFSLTGWFTDCKGYFADVMFQR